MKTTNLQQVELAFPKNMMSTSRSEFNMPNNFAKDVKNMIIHYSGAGSKRNGFKKYNFELPESEKILELLHFPNQQGTLQLLAFTYLGNVYKQENNANWELIYSGLAENTKIYSTMFANKLIISNGVDNMLKYDGEKLETIKQYISQDKFSFSIASDTSIKTDSFAQNYEADRSLKIEFTNGDIAYSTVKNTTTSLEEGFIVLHINDAVITSEIKNISYELIAPKFRQVYSAHDRLWAFGTDSFDINLFNKSVDRTRVYYTDITNDESSWYDDEGNLSSINISDKMPESEELIGMSIKDGMTVFLCRNYSQIWTGTNPRALGDFAWNKTIPVGLIHPSLIVSMPNDIGFFSQFGARTFSRFLQTEQLDVNDMGSEISNKIHESIDKLRINNDSLNIHSFSYHKQSWFGFKLADEVLIFQATATGLSWSYFDGIFKDATSFLNTPDGKLYSSVGNKIYIYDDGVYADDDQPIHTTWTTAWFSPNKSKAWANKYTEIVLEPTALNDAVLQRYKNYNNASYTAKQINLKSLPDYFNTAYWDNGFFDTNEKDKAIVRDKFIANTLSFSFQTRDKQGPLTIYSVRFHGSKEK